MTQDPPQTAAPLMPPLQPISVPVSAPFPQRLVVTIDGPAGTGKSTTARQLAKRLGVDFLDTGAMYRAAAVLALDAGLDQNSPEQVASVLEAADLHFDWSQDPPSIKARSSTSNDWVDLSSRIRHPQVDKLVSPLAGIAEVRRQLVRKQRLIGQHHPRLVTEGRDQGTVVFDDAEVKFFLWASPEVRAQRRVEQLKAAGIDADGPAILADIIARDASDMSRAVGPLVRPADAIDVDTSNLGFSQVLDLLEHHVRTRIAAIRRA